MTSQPRSYDHVIILDVHDGDSLVAEIDFGFRLRHVVQVRLARINAPEITGSFRADGLLSRTRLRELLPIGTAIRIVTFKNGREKYGRYLADVMIEDVNINDQMVSEGFAVYREY